MSFICQCISVVVIVVVLVVVEVVGSQNSTFFSQINLFYDNEEKKKLKWNVSWTNTKIQMKNSSIISIIISCCFFFLDVNRTAKALSFKPKGFKTVKNEILKKKLREFMLVWKMFNSRICFGKSLIFRSTSNH